MSSLFTTYDQVKEIIGADASNELDTIQPYITDAANDYVIPFLGQVEYDTLLAHFTDDVMTSDDEALLVYVRKILVHFAYYLFADDGTMSISDSGFIRQEHTEGKSAYQWQVRAFKDRRWNNGWRAIEAMNIFLYKNLGNYTSWYASDERAVWNKHFVWNTLNFKLYHRISGLDTLYNLQPTISEVEEKYIRPHITSSIYNDMLTRIMEGATTEDDLELLPYIRRVIVFKSLEEIADNFGYEFGKDGLQNSSIDSNTQNTDKRANTVREARAILKKEFQTKFLEARNLMINFLNENASASKYEPYYTKFINVTATEVTDSNTDKGVVFLGF
jgi:hypothetical protein